jgi:hypothetical protein
MPEIFVLVHSPLVGPLTWSLVAEELRRRGHEALVPALADREGAGVPYWDQHARSVAEALRSLPERQPVVLAGHSGAGPLLPATRAAAGRPVAGYLFVDAGIPEDGLSRLDLLERELPEAAAQWREVLEAGERIPVWQEDDLREVIPDARLRGGMIAELCPRPLGFYTELLPVFDGWPDAPCGFLRFAPGYAVPAQQARECGWAYREIAAGHFHMLVDPAGVADALLSLTAEMEA